LKKVDITFQFADRRVTDKYDAATPFENAAGTAYDYRWRTIVMVAPDAYFEHEAEAAFRQNVRELRQALEDVCYYWQDQQQLLFACRDQIDGMVRALVSLGASDLVGRRQVALDFRNGIGQIWLGTATLLAQARRNFRAVNFH
jgi:hypothetical protein